MSISQKQFEEFSHLLPVKRREPEVSDIQVINALIHVATTGIQWRDLPPEFGNWHTIYTRVNRWSKNGVLSKIFEELQKKEIIRVKIEVFEPKNEGKEPKAELLDNTENSDKNPANIHWVPSIARKN